MAPFDKSKVSFSKVAQLEQTHPFAFALKRVLDPPQTPQFDSVGVYPDRQSILNSKIRVTNSGFF